MVAAAYTSTVRSNGELYSIALARHSIHEVKLTSSLRKAALATHITVSVGWIGAAAAYLVVVVAAMTNGDAQSLRTAWSALDLIGWYAIVPFAVTSVITGVVISLMTPWGLFRHYWVLISFALSCFAAVVLLEHMPTVSSFARLTAATGAVDLDALRAALRGELLHAGVGLLVLLAIEALNVFKPQGLTAYGRRRAAQLVPRSADIAGVLPLRDQDYGARVPMWVRVVGAHAVAVAALFVILHLASGGLRHH